MLYSSFREGSKGSVQFAAALAVMYSTAMRQDDATQLRFHGIYMQDFTSHDSQLILTLPPGSRKGQRVASADEPRGNFFTAIRHRDPLMCPLGAVARLLVEAEAEQGANLQLLSKAGKGNLSYKKAHLFHASANTAH